MSDLLDPMIDFHLRWPFLVHNGEPHLTFQVLIKLPRQPCLLPIVYIERPLDVPPPPLLYLRPESRHRIHMSLLGTDPSEPPMSRGDVGHLVCVDHLHHSDCVHVTGLLEALDCPWIHVQPACFVDKMDDGEPGAEGVGGYRCGFPERCVYGHAAVWR